MSRVVASTVLVGAMVLFTVATSGSASSGNTRAQVGVGDDAPSPRRGARRGGQSGPGVYEDGLPYCQNNLDCDGVGNWCKDRGDGIKLCMNGENGPGSYCKSGLDCRHGLFCKDRGDGLKACMGSNSGPKGSFCNSNLDCRTGDWCKDRGDGMKVCM